MPKAFLVKKEQTPMQNNPLQQQCKTDFDNGNIVSQQDNGAVVAQAAVVAAAQAAAGGKNLL